MAEFDAVHRKAMPDRALKRGEPWRIALREPLEFAALGPGAVAADARVQVVTFVVNERNRLVPASTEDRDLVDDWKKRHRTTSPDWFDPPEGFYRD